MNKKITNKIYDYLLDDEPSNGKLLLIGIPILILHLMFSIFLMFVRLGYKKEKINKHYEKM